MSFFPHLQAPRPDVRAFLDDIREHPDDDTPRLVLADWLDDYGDDADRARASLRQCSRSVRIVFRAAAR